MSLESVLGYVGSLKMESLKMHSIDAFFPPLLMSLLLVALKN